MPTRRRFLSALPALGLLNLPLRASAAAPVQVVTTTGMIADAVRRIGGDLVEVKTLMGPGIDPHGYRQTRTDIVAMSRADLILWNGLYLEAQLEDVLGDMTAITRVDPVAEAIPADSLIGHDVYEGRFDPHVWMDPDLWSVVALRVRDMLIEMRPDAEAVFTANAAQFATEIVSLGTYADEVLLSVPEASRVLVTAHDAFNYFGRRYGFEVAGIQGISTQSEAGLSRISEIVDLLVERGIGAVFVESSVSDRNIRALTEGAAARGHSVSVGGELFSDAMGVPGTYEGTWLGMIDHNVTTISRALGGVAPEAGWQGNLS